MSLLDTYMRDCVMMDKVSVPDGYGGFTSEYQEGAAFKCTIVQNSSMQARIGAQMGVKDVFTVTTKRGVTLQFHDVFKEVETGDIYRVTSDGVKNETPTTASINMRQVNAEKWELPNG